MYLDSRLTYKTHINTTIRKTYGVMRQIYSLMAKNSKLSITNKRLIYIMILRPILLYAAPVWCSAAPTNIKILQTYQNKCLRLILNKDRYEKIEKLHEETSISMIQKYINEIGQRFYVAQLNNGIDLLKETMCLDKSRRPKKWKYKLAYENLNVPELD